MKNLAARKTKMVVDFIPSKQLFPSCPEDVPSKQLFPSGAEEGIAGTPRVRTEMQSRMLSLTHFDQPKNLKAKGIHFRPSTTFFLNDFAFTSRFGYGRLTLPQLVFGYGMRYFLLNMMAYELAPSIELIEWEICNYIYFMNSLINGAEDVMELRTHGVIHNFYGTDEEVAKAFNSMATGGAFVCYQGPIKDANDGIQEHYNSTMKTWTAQLWNNYFSTPWSAVAFLAATFALILTIIQTFFPR
ncbi:uncharacterized protein LOC132313542 [Cornus florida]|uniref:uncharacterized protein LOC132313542 n=1 Tax=Cornus florida TaxID=4283 RepID=UPI00289B1D16|nr:uncharacterized protein LOC132313542 [Cornus florida]XP_059668333.1 uncharacterized protein LOC132313542 [Cornus florida]